MILKVELLAHRGLWKKAEQKNTEEAFHHALVAGYGVETDVRDCNGSLVISHDLPRGNEQTFEDFLCRYNEVGSQSTLAINIKADGLAEELQRLLECFDVRNYFCFDMSVPDARAYTKLGMPVFARRSELEPPSLLTQVSPGIWLDGFDGTWFDHAEWTHWLELGKSVCVVSPELHRRPHEKLWGELKSWILGIEKDQVAESKKGFGRMLLCTDFPKEFEVFQCQ
jgi:hypothetical protein